MNSTRRVVAALALAYAAGLSCVEPTGAGSSIEWMGVAAPSGATVAPGATLQLGAVMLDNSLDTIAGVPVVWRTNALSVATVTATGLVTGVAPGTATITAIAENSSAQLTVTVAWPPCAAESIQGELTAADSTSSNFTAATCLNLYGIEEQAWTFTLPDTTTIMASAKGGAASILQTEILDHPSGHHRRSVRSAIAGQAARVGVTLAPGTYRLAVSRYAGAAGPFSVVFHERSVCDGTEIVAPLVAVDGSAEFQLDDSSCIFPAFLTEGAGYVLDLAAPTAVQLDVTAGFAPWIIVTTENTATRVGLGLPIGASAGRFADELPAGSYRVWVTFWRDVPANFELTRSVPVLVRCEDAPAVGEAVLGGTVNGALSNDDCRIEGLRRSDPWTITLAEETTLNIQVTGTEFAPVVYVVDADGNVVAEDPESCGTAEVTVTLAPGTYRILPSSQAAGWNGPYSILTTTVP